MTCPSCQNKVTPPTCSCADIEICACETKILDSCVTISDSYTCLGIVAGDDLDTAISSMNDTICALNNTVIEGFGSGFLDCSLLLP